LNALAETPSSIFELVSKNSGAPRSLQAFLRDLVLALCPDTIRSVQERVGSMHFPKPLARDVAGYCAERLASGLFDEPRGLDLPKALLPCFIGLSDELDRAIQSGAVEHWLRGATGHGFSVEFVARLVEFLDDCLAPHRREAA
jgi:hypothetical protein